MNDALPLIRTCDACGTQTKWLTPVITSGDTPNDPPMVCIDWQTCVRAYRLGASAATFAMVVLRGKL